MKKTRILLIFALLSTFSGAQGIKKVYSEDLTPIAKEFGIDSVFNVTGGLPIFSIDSIVALELCDYVPDVFTPHRSEYIFKSMVNKRLNEPIKKKTFENAIEKLKIMMGDSINKECETHSIDDESLISLIKQNPDSIDNQIIKCYHHCDKLATEYKKIFPSAFSRFISSFKYGGAHPTVKAYYNSQLNCYELMWTLEKLQSKYFEETKLNRHYSKLKNWKQNRDRIRFFDPHFEYVPMIAILDKPYNSINEIDFLSIPILKIMLAGYDNDKKCWKYMLINNNMAFLVLGNQNGSLGGHGATFKLEIIEKTKLKITEISAWVS